MMAFLTQMVFAARNDDFEGWTQILVVVVMAVVYGLGGILKAAKSKKLDGKEGQEQQGRPFDHAQGRQPRPAGAVARRVYEAYQAYQATSQPQRPEVTPEPAPSEQAVPKLDTKVQEIPEITFEIEKLPEFISETTKGLEQEHKEARAVVYLGQPLLDVSDPEAIRRAIIHYEIFGKPLALRENDK